MQSNKLPTTRRARLLLGVSLTALVIIVAGCGGGGGASPVTNAVITVATPSISPASGNYMGTQQVTIADSTSGSAIYYTIDGTLPTASSMPYGKPLSVSVSSTIQATAFLNGTQSGIAQSKLTIAPLPTTLAFTQQPTNAQAGAILSPAVTVQVEDSSGTVLTSATNAVTVSLTTGSGLGGALTAMPQNGIATFSNLSVSAAGIYTLTASSPNLTAATSTSFTIAPVPAELAFVQEPSNALTGVTISPAVTVAVEDSNGNAVANATNPVTLMLTNGSGLAGTLTATPQNGVATFTNLSESAAGSFTLVASSTGLVSATSASFTITGHSATGSLYYISPSGNDANTGVTPDAAWLSPKHSLNCGDTITAAAGAYSAPNFFGGNWGTVTCPAANSVAWLQCATFDACKIIVTAGTAEAMWVDQNYWGVQGFEASVSAGVIYGACFVAGPDGNGTVHHIIFANNIANGCAHGGFITFNQGKSAGADYVAIIGNIAYNTAQGSGACASGISVYQPVASDTNTGTHIFIAGNFSYGNFDPAVCAGGPSTDGEGIIIDTLDFSQGGGTPYTQQVAVENNMVLGNGSFGLEAFNNQAGATHAPIYFEHTTSWGNMKDTNQVKSGSGEITLADVDNVHVDMSIAQTVSATGFGGNAIYGLAIVNGDATNSVTGNVVFGVSGNNTIIANVGAFAFGANNQFGVNPSFTSPAVPPAPSCGATSNVPSCMAHVIADFVPTTSTAVGLGYQAPGSTPAADALFPQWLCTANLPSGLISTPCN